MLLPHTAFDGAMGRQAGWSQTAKTPFPISAKVLNVTVSAGVATLAEASQRG